MELCVYVITNTNYNEALTYTVSTFSYKFTGVTTDLDMVIIQECGC
jgi:hypothetical protein